MIPRVMDLRGTYKGGGGPDKTVLNSAVQHDPKRVCVLVTYLRSPHDREFRIAEMASRLGANYIDVADAKLVDRACLRKLKEILGSRGLTVVHAHDEKTLLYGWLLKLITPGLRIMYTCHSHADYRRADFPRLRDYLTFKMRQRMLISLMQRYLPPILTVSRDTKKRLVAKGLTARNINVLHNGIDISFWHRDAVRPGLKQELGMTPANFLIGTVARISHDKDLSTFYEVAEEVTKHSREVKFVIVGDGYGNELALARAEVARRGLEGTVLFTGHRSDLRQIYASFDVFLMTSLTEGMPNALLEAMAMAVPAVCTRVGGIPELLTDGKHGFLAPAGDAHSLSAAILHLINDPALLVQCGAAGRQQVEQRFSFSRRVRLMEDYYAWFAGSGPRPNEVLTDIN